MNCEHNDVGVDGNICEWQLGQLLNKGIEHDDIDIDDKFCEV